MSQFCLASAPGAPRGSFPSLRLRVIFFISYRVSRIAFYATHLDSYFSFFPSIHSFTLLRRQTPLVFASTICASPVTFFLQQRSKHFVSLLFVNNSTIATWQRPLKFSLGLFPAHQQLPLPVQRALPDLPSSARGSPKPPAGATALVLDPLLPHHEAAYTWVLPLLPLPVQEPSTTSTRRT